jgi:hypothetical protein
VSHQPNEDPSEEEKREALKQWYDSQDTIIMPWVRVLEDETVETATIEMGRLTFPTAGNDGLLEVESLDILASGHQQMPFLRRVVSIEREAGRVVFHTRTASLTEAVYKGRLHLGQAVKQSPDQPQMYERRDQPLSPEYIVTGESSFDDGDKSDESEGFLKGADGKATAGWGVTGRPYFSLEPELHIDIAIGGSFSDHHPQARGCDTWDCNPKTGSEDSCDCVYKGQRSCNSADDCFEYDYCVNDDWTTDPNDEDTCGYNARFNIGADAARGKEEWEDVSHSCAMLVKVLKKMKEDEDCKNIAERYYENPTYTNGMQTAANNCSLRFLGYPISEYRLPTPAQAEWAKENCSGTLEKFEFDMKMSPQAGFKNIGIYAVADANVSATLLDPAQTKATAWRGYFFIGGLPVVFSINGSIGASVTASATAALNIDFKPIRTGLVLRGGFHYYGSKSVAEQNSFTQPDELRGTFSPEFRENYYDGVEYPAPLDDDDESTGLFELQDQEFSDFLQTEIDVELKVQTEINLLIYEAVGPFVRPISVYGNVRYDNTASCKLGAMAGIQSEIGLKASVPFCSSCGSGELSLASYDTCGDYCGNDAAPPPLCLWACISGNYCDGSSNVASTTDLLVKVTNADNPRGKNDVAGVEIQRIYLKSDQDIKEPTAVMVDGVSIDPELLKSQSDFPTCDVTLDELPNHWQSDGHGVVVSDSMVLQFEKAEIDPDDQIIIERAQTAACTASGTVAFQLGNTSEGTWGPPIVATEWNTSPVTLPVSRSGCGSPTSNANGTVGYPTSNRLCLVPQDYSRADQ